MATELDSSRLIGCMASTHNHLLVLADPDALPLHNLHVLQTREDLVLHLELRNHCELGALLDLERLVLQGRLSTLLGKINCDRWAALGIHRQRENDALAGVGRVGDGWACGETEGGLVALEGLILSI